MVSEAILGAIVGGSAAIFGSFVQAWFNRQNTKDRIYAEKQRYHAKIYAGRKVDALAQLHSQFVECRQIMSKQLGIKADDMTEQEVQEKIISRTDSLQAALDKATIFLEEEQIDALSDAYLSISTAGEYIKKETQGEPHDMLRVESGQLIEDTEAAMDVLEQEINGPIENFESD